MSEWNFSTVDISKYSIRNILWFLSEHFLRIIVDFLKNVVESAQEHFWFSEIPNRPVGKLGQFENIYLRDIWRFWRDLCGDMQKGSAKGSVSYSS